MFEKIRSWYLKGYWTAEMIECAVEKGVITPEQAANLEIVKSGYMDITP